MKPLYLGDERLEEWDAFTQSHEDGTIYHGSGWKSVLQQAFPHIKGQFLALVDSSNESILAGMPLYCVRSWILGNRLVSTPFATWCNPLVSNSDQFKLLLQEAEKLARRLSCKRIEVRMRNQKACTPHGWTEEIRWKHHTVPLGDSSEKLWQRLHQNAIRQPVRRSEKNGVSVRTDFGGRELEIFYEALVETRKRLQLPMIPYSYFSSLLKTYSDREANILLATREGMPLGACLTLQNNRMCHLELTGEFPEARALGAMQLLVWKALLKALADGCSEFSFGRTSIDNHGLANYKKRWGTVEENLSALTWNSSGTASTGKSYSRLESLTRFINTVLPRPLYKRFGTLIYSHWG